jgi:hypothetical protein
MYLDEPYFPGGGFSGPVCRACKQPFGENERTTRVQFASDPEGDKGLTGDYHLNCAKPFASMARAINAMSRFGR